MDKQIKRRYINRMDFPETVFSEGKKHKKDPDFPSLRHGAFLHREVREYLWRTEGNGRYSGEEKSGNELRFSVYARNLATHHPLVDGLAEISRAERVPIDSYVPSPKERRETRALESDFAHQGKIVLVDVPSVG